MGLVTPLVHRDFAEKVHLRYRERWKRRLSRGIRNPSLFVLLVENSVVFASELGNLTASISMLGHLYG